MLRDFSFERGEAREGVLMCEKCGREYPIIGFLPILTPRRVKPYDWISVELTKAEERYGLKEAIPRLAKGELKPVELKPGELLLTQEELREGERRDSREYWENRLKRIREERVASGDLSELWDAFVAMSRVETIEKVLDAGTGLGAMLMYITRKWPDKILLALDISYVNLRAVRGKLRYFRIGGNVHLVVGDALNMPFRDSVFDVVESWFGLGNMVGFRRVMGQAHRVLRPGGYLAVSGAWEKAYLNPRYSVFGKVVDALTSQEYEELTGFLRRTELMLRVDEVVEAFRGVGFHDTEVFEKSDFYVVAGRK